MDTIYENNKKCYFFQENALTLLLKINQINILIEEYKFDSNNIGITSKQENIITFFILSGSNDSSHSLDILIIFNEKFYKNNYGDGLIENNKINNILSYENTLLNNHNEFIQSLIVINHYKIFFL